MDLIFRRAGFVTVLAIACLAAWWRFQLPGLQWSLFAITLGWLGFRFFFILDLVMSLLLRNFLLAALVVAFYAVLTGRVLASSLGVMNLFWHEDMATRFAAALFSTLFFGLIFLATFYADPEKEATQGRLKSYLRNRRTLFDIVRVTLKWIRTTFRSIWE